MSDKSPKRSEALSMMESTESETDEKPRRHVLRNAAAGLVAAVGLAGTAAALEVEPSCNLATGIIDGTCYEIECCDDGSCGTNGTASGCSGEDYDCCEEFCFGEPC